MLESLDVAIGLVVVYLVLALACTALNEGISAHLQWRAKTLKQGIARMLGPERTAAFYAHPLIQSLHENHRAPAYIPATAFRLVLLDLLCAPQQHPDPPPVQAPEAPEAPDAAADRVTPWLDGLQADDLRKVLKSLARSAGPDLDRLNDHIESWFNSSMERVAGWYKRYVQLVVAGLAVALTVICNADTLEIARRLAQDDALRAQVVARAEALAAQPPTPQSARAELVELERLGQLSGWGGNWRALYPGWHPGLIALSKSAGLLITALAVSLGAPFWFDVLNKVINIRAAGRAPEEGPKKPEDHPKRWS